MAYTLFEKVQELENELMALVAEFLAIVFLKSHETG